MSLHDRKDGWQQAAVLKTGDRLKTLSMQANFPVSQYYTVQFGVIVPLDPLFSGFDAVAEITWIVEGQLVRRRVSVGNGVSVSGPGQAVKVVVSDVSIPAIAGFEYTVSVQVTPGTRPSVSRPPTLRGFSVQQALLGGGTLDLAVPENAGVISVETSYAFDVAQPTVGFPILVQQSSFFGAIKSYYANVETGFVALAPNAQVVTLFNLDVHAYFVQWTWGIDG